MPILPDKARKLTRLLATPTCVDVKPRKETSPNWPATGRLQGHTKLTYPLDKFAAFLCGQVAWLCPNGAKICSTAAFAAGIWGYCRFRWFDRAGLGEHGVQWPLLKLRAEPVGHKLSDLSCKLWANVGNNQGSFKLIPILIPKGQFATNPSSTHENYPNKHRNLHTIPIANSHIQQYGNIHTLQFYSYNICMYMVYYVYNCL